MNFLALVIGAFFALLFFLAIAQALITALGGPITVLVFFVIAGFIYARWRHFHLHHPRNDIPRPPREDRDDDDPPPHPLF